MITRRSNTVRAAVIGLSIGCLALAGCSNSPAPSSPQSTTESPASQASHSDEPAPAAESTSEPAETAETPVPADDAAPIGPNGIGQLLLGTTFQEAKDDDFVRGKEMPGCVSYDMYLGGERWGLVFISPDRGVEAIAPERAVRTVEDVAIGATTDQVAATYPDFDANLLGQLDHVGVRVPGHPDATYRLQFDESKKKLTGISLQLTDQGCYE